MGEPLYDWRQTANSALTGQKHYDQDKNLSNRIDAISGSFFNSILTDNGETLIDPVDGNVLFESA